MTYDPRPRREHGVVVVVLVVGSGQSHSPGWVRLELFL